MWFIYLRSPGIHEHKFQESGYIWSDKKVGGNNEGLTEKIKGDSWDLSIKVGGKHAYIVNSDSLCFIYILYIFCTISTSTVDVFCEPLIISIYSLIPSDIYISIYIYIYILYIEHVYSSKRCDGKLSVSWHMGKRIESSSLTTGKWVQG